MKLVETTLLCALGFTMLPSTAVSVERDDDAFYRHAFTLPLDTTGFPNGMRLRSSVGVGSGAYHRPGDPDDIVYSVTDRGVNIKCKADRRIIGIDLCAKGKIFPVPSFTPTIFTYRIDRSGITLIDALKIKDGNGQAIDGLPNPLLTTDTERAYDRNGDPIPPSPEGLDVEGMVRLSDGSYWLADEYAPSLVHVAATGEILERRVPAGVDTDLASADYPVTGSLPAIVARRKLNRGFESIAVSGDERFLFASLQSPLANPDKAAYAASRNVRLFKMDRRTGMVLAEYVYRLDPPTSFADDQTSKQNKVKVSEMTWYGPDQLIVLERISKTTKLYRIDLSRASNILGTAWDRASTSPSLEQSDDLGELGIVSVEKHLVMDSSRDYPGLLPAKIEGIALLSDDRAILVNDNDFGITGARTVFSQITLGRDR